jgi:hypothetical protein
MFIHLLVNMSTTSLKHSGFDISPFIVACKRRQVLVPQTLLKSVVLSENFKSFKEGVSAKVFDDFFQIYGNHVGPRNLLKSMLIFV